MCGGVGESREEGDEEENINDGAMHICCNL